MSIGLCTLEPAYTLKAIFDPKSAGKRNIWFKFGNYYYYCLVTLSAKTTTTGQKFILAWWTGKEPIISISHSFPTKADRGSFTDPTKPNRTFHPTAVASGEFTIMGREEPIKIKIYFCDVDVQEPDSRPYRCQEGYIVEAQE